jgi:hypothetical protein
MVSLTTTISTPTNFVEYAKSIDENDPTRAFVENMVDESDVMRAIPIMPAERGKRAYMDIGSLPAVGFRGFNEAGEPGNGQLQPPRGGHLLHRRLYLRRPRDDRPARSGGQVQAGEAQEHRARPVLLAEPAQVRQLRQPAHAERHPGPLPGFDREHRQPDQQHGGVRRRRALPGQPRRALLAREQADALDRAARPDAISSTLRRATTRWSTRRRLCRRRFRPPHHQVQGPPDPVRIRAG